MGQPMRHIHHPGAVAAQRNTVLDASLQSCQLQLQPGRSLLSALTEAFAPSGATSAVLTLSGGELFPFAHVMPALSKSPAHAVYFSDQFDAQAPVQLEFATVTYGLRDGHAWLHCHAVWTDAEGMRHCGHLLPDESMLTTSLLAKAWVLTGAGFEVVPDEETHFSLFKPAAWPAKTPAQTSTQTPAPTPAPSPGPTPGPTARPALAIRIAPNQDVCSALESICREHGIQQASVRGGVGSTVGAWFDDGRRVEAFVTETLVRHGRVHPGPDGQPLAEIDVSMVDHLGGQASGRLMRGANPVLVTFELVLELT